MREIILRGKRVDNGEWVEGEIIFKIMEGVRDENPSMHCRIPNEMFGQFIDVIPETVGQFTGLLDKNGKRIFEGDILLGMEEGNGETTAWEQVRYKIEFNPKSTAFVGVETGADNWDIEISDINTYYEIIGSIHDNPAFTSVAAYYVQQKKA